MHNTSLWSFTLTSGCTWRGCLYVCAPVGLQEHSRGRLLNNEPVNEHPLRDCNGDQSVASRNRWSRAQGICSHRYTSRTWETGHRRTRPHMIRCTVHEWGADCNTVHLSHPSPPASTPGPHDRQRWLPRTLRTANTNSAKAKQRKRLEMPPQELQSSPAFGRSKSVQSVSTGVAGSSKSTLPLNKFSEDAVLPNCLGHLQDLC